MSICFRSCLNEACYKKKVVNYKCPKCNIVYSNTSVGHSVNGTLKVKGKPQIHFFTQQAEAMRSQLEIQPSVTNDEFLPALISKLPISASLKTKDNKVVSIKIIQ